MNLNSNISALNSRVSAVNASLTDVDGRVGNLENRTTTIEATVDGLDTRLSKLELPGKQRGGSIDICNFLHVFSFISFNNDIC